ncbi:hypothetical protein NDS46_30610 (plasmid) [Paenibacillus thiaminolyticus]|uniref:hypothetical protein n=1 Tax=Paenibacillus thiaminolyticus TaxID=49283 RepID=UPI00232B3AD0|nr:hypothetical protein [Paenibacillus thiaminolyticus]WCF11702.1 hypothetical protein NDS46_30610 [Paenibacillus thiaminolyticus]
MNLIQKVLDKVGFEPIEKELVKDDFPREIREFFSEKGILVSYNIVKHRRTSLWAEEVSEELWLMDNGTFNLYSYSYYWESAGKEKYQCFRELISEEINPLDYFPKDEIEEGIEKI